MNRGNHWKGFIKERGEGGSEYPIDLTDNPYPRVNLIFQILAIFLLDIPGYLFKVFRILLLFPLDILLPGAP